MNALLPLALLLASAAPAPSVALLPLEPLGIDFERATATQRAVRDALASLPGIRLLDEQRTRELLEQHPALASCAELLCLARAAEVLGVDSVVSGVAGGLGGFQSLVLKRTDRQGKVVTSVNEALFENWQAQVAPLVGTLMGADAAAPASTSLAVVPAPEITERAAWRRPTALALGAGALAALGTGIGFGLASRAVQTELESGRSGCAGSGEAYANCVAERFSTGRSRATVANVFLGVGGALGLGALGLWLWPEQSQPVVLGPGPAPLGLSAHARF